MKQQLLRDRIDQVVRENKNDPFRREQELKKLLKEAEKNAERESDLYAIGKISMLLANSILGQGRRGTMLSYAYKAVSIFEKTNERALLARSYNLLGIAYSGLGNYLRAVSAYNNGLRILHGRDCDLIKKNTLLNNISDAYYHMGVYEKSYSISTDCYENYRHTVQDNPLRAIVFGLNVCDSCLGLENYKRAKEILDEIKGEIDNSPKSIYVCAYYTRLSYVLYVTGDMEGGEKFTDMAFELIDLNLDYYDNHIFYTKIAAIQIDHGDYDRALRYYAAMAKYAEENNHALDLIMAKSVRANICRARGEQDQALAIYKELSALYETWISQQRAMQYEGQKSLEDANKEIVKLMKKIKSSNELAERDPLTDLMNRSSLIRVSSNFLQTAKEKKRHLGGIFFDIDCFKEYNDHYGHAAGDEAIKLVANVCKSEESATIKFFRYGGDEYFGVILGHSDESIEKLALRISEKVHDAGLEHVLNSNGKRLTVSIGIVNLDMRKSDATILDIIKFADKALYRAKNSGRDCVYTFRYRADSGNEYKQVVQ